MQIIKIGNIKIEVKQKNIKNIHLSVYPPEGHVRIATPMHLDLDTIRIYAISKIDWIKRQQNKFKDQERETKREFLNRETHFYKGEGYLLKIIENSSTNSVEINHNSLVLYSKGKSNEQLLQKILDKWYRAELKKEMQVLFTKWEQKINVKTNKINTRKMKTKWGSCNRESGRILINSELIKKPIECLEYVVIHELVHLLEKNHNKVFTAYMNRYLPQWKSIRDELNKLPLSM